jgi:uncharacterized membrane protein
MRGKRCLWAVFALSATLLIGIGEARSQTAQLRVCNQSHQTASVAVARQAGIYDTRFLLTGWFNVDPGYCNTTGVLIPWGYYYLFAESLVTGAMWSGNDQRFCVDVSYRFSRFIDSSPGCPPGLQARGFTQYYVSGTNLVTWTLND